jgi:C4-dicarboxylate-specific signal transduction histidine kinase
MTHAKKVPFNAEA